MRRYGAGPTVSSTTTTEDPQEFLNEVRLSQTSSPFLSPGPVFSFLCVLPTGPLPCCFCKHLFLVCFEGFFLLWDQQQGFLLQDVFGNRSA